MSKNLNALLRYKIIHNCLSSPIQKKWTWEDLAQACGDELKEVSNIDNVPSRRTILQDIKVMRQGDLGYRAPIGWSRARGYHYTNQHFSIYNYPLSQLERLEFAKGVQIIRQVSLHLGMDEVDQIITKLNHIINEQDYTGPSVIHFDRWVHENVPKWLNMLYHSIRDRHAVLISYRPFTHTSSFSGVVSPYLLKEYRNRWYLIAKFHSDGHIYHYALDRLMNVKRSIQPFKPEPKFKPDKYFEHIIGISLPPDGELTKIRFKSKYVQANYLQTKPLHKSQKIVEQTDEYVIFEIEVIPNFELESNLLAFGEHLEVLSPVDLRKKIRARVQAMKAIYNG